MSQPTSLNSSQPSVNNDATSTAQRTNITLVNNTNATICYQALKYTGPRHLEGQSEITLEALPQPLTVTFYREDGGLIRVKQTRTYQGMKLTFTEASTLGNDREAMTIDSDGTVSIY
ncbi:MAG: hypothetical protein NVS2B14_20820 [Chamaesiphon sp.]